MSFFLVHCYLCPFDFSEPSVTGEETLEEQIKDILEATEEEEAPTGTEREREREREKEREREGERERERKFEFHVHTHYILFI